MPRVEIRNYDGVGDDLADLVGRTWKTTYTGRMWFPVWDRPYFLWRLLDDRIRSRDFFVCAYQGTKLVGCLMAEPLDFKVRDQTVKGTLSSWLSVDPEIRVPGIAFRLFEGLRQRHREHEMALSIGCTSTDPTLPNSRFWDSLAKRKPEDFHDLGTMRFWTRVFDAKGVAAAGLNYFERLGSRIAGYIPWGWIGWRKGSGVRPYQRADLPRCHDWLHAQAEDADIKILWSAQRIDLQLGHPTYPRTLVIEDQTGKGAFLNYYPIAFSGNTVIKVAVIDLLAGNISLGKKIDLIKASGRQMMADGIQMAVMMQSSASPALPLLAAGFIPISAHQKLFSIFPNCGLSLNPPLRLHILFS